ncbi:MAG TPA: hypothetical protein VN541_11515, partial [Tepidisphaeraceae bacterium]|nr:hypothetical protein [Tepidisphaeraceae bacterium]
MYRVLATCLALACVLAFASTTPAQSTHPSTSDGPRVSSDELLKEFSDPDWRQRRQGMQQLLQAGDEAEVILTALLRRDLAQETRKNVETALHLVRDNRLLGPSLISLHVKDASPGQVFADISGQCHGAVPCEPDDLWNQKAWPKLTLDVDRRPFWQVVQDLAPRLGVEYLSSDPDEVRISRGSNRPDSVCVSGAFLLTAN